jgi:hypothetical protein
MELTIFLQQALDSQQSSQKEEAEKLKSAIKKISNLEDQLSALKQSLDLNNQEKIKEKSEFSRILLETQEKFKNYQIQAEKLEKDLKLEIESNQTQSSEVQKKLRENLLKTSKELEKSQEECKSLKTSENRLKIFNQNLKNSEDGLKISIDLLKEKHLKALTEASEKHLKEINTLKANLSKINLEQEQLIKNFQQEVKTLQEKIQQKDQEIENLENHFKETQTTLESETRSKINELNEKIMNLKSNHSNELLQQLNLHTSELNSANHSNSLETSQLKQENLSLDLKIKDLEEKFTIKEKKLEESLTEQKRLSRELNESKKTLEDLESDFKDLEDLNSSLQKELLTGSLKSEEKSLKLLENQLNESCEEILSLKSQLTSSKDLLNFQAQEIKTLNEALSSKTESLKELENLFQSQQQSLWSALDEIIFSWSQLLTIKNPNLTILDSSEKKLQNLRDLTSRVEVQLFNHLKNSEMLREKDLKIKELNKSINLLSQEILLFKQKEEQNRQLLQKKNSEIEFNTTALQVQLDDIRILKQKLQISEDLLEKSQKENERINFEVKDLKDNLDIEKNLRIENQENLKTLQDQILEEQRKYQEIFNVLQEKQQMEKKDDQENLLKLLEVEKEKFRNLEEKFRNSEENFRNSEEKYRKFEEKVKADHKNLTFLNSKYQTAAKSSESDLREALSKCSSKEFKIQELESTLLTLQTELNLSQSDKSHPPSTHQEDLLNSLEDSQNELKKLRSLLSAVESTGCSASKSQILKTSEILTASSSIIQSLVTLNYHSVDGRKLILDLRRDSQKHLEMIEEVNSYLTSLVQAMP